jgi:type II secretory pathway pseudopilin PulG
MTEGERGFALTELLLCVGLLALAAAATLGAVAAVAHRAMPNATRDAAMMVAENTLARARASAAYVAVGSGVAPADPGSASLVVSGSTSFTAGAELRAENLCGSGPTSQTLHLPVRTTYSGAVFSVTVAYPRDPCLALGGTIPAGDAMSVTLNETLPPPLYVPGHVVLRPVGVPARM